jgi:hypothetical protein
MILQISLQPINLKFRTSLILYSILSGNLYFIFLNLWVQKETAVIDIDDEDNAPKDQVPMENKESASVSKSKKGSLVQATISSLFKKVEVKVCFWNCLSETQDLATSNK